MRLIDYYELFQTLEPDLTWQMIDKINGLKPVDAVPVRHGHWIEKMIPTGVYAFGVDEMTCEELECSICCKHFWVGEERNYCPNCGAKMDGGSE